MSIKKISQVSPSNFTDSPLLYPQVGKQGIVMDLPSSAPFSKKDFTKDTLQQETSLDEIAVNLSSMYEELKKRQPLNAYETIVLEIEPYEMKKNYESVLVKLEENIKSDDLENLASGNLTLSDQCKLHILNFFAYFKNVKALCVLFTIFLNKGCNLKIDKDPFNRDVLDIALEYKNFSLCKSIIEDLTRNPPPMGKWPSFNLEKLIAIFKMKIPDPGRLIDSRLFNVDLDPKFNFCKPFKGLKAMFFNEFPKNDEIKEELFSIHLSKYFKWIQFLHQFLHPSSTSTVDFVQIQENDMVGLIEEFKNIRLFLKSIYENYTPYDDIYKSVFVEALIENKWYSYCFKLFEKEMLIFSFEVLFQQNGLSLVENQIFLENAEVPRTNLYIIVVIGVFIIFYLLFREIKEFVKEGFSYFNSVKSVIDIFYLLAYGSVEVLLLIMVVSDQNFKSNENTTVQIYYLLKSSLFFFFCIKGIWFVQISPKLGSMLRIIFYSALHTVNFFVAYMCLICTLIVSITGLHRIESSADYFLNFIANVQLSMGDASSFFNLLDNSWITMYGIYVYYIISTGIITILSLNLLITILGDGYAIINSKQQNLINQTTLAVCLDLDSGYEVTEGLELKKKQNIIATFYRIFIFLLNSIILSKVKVSHRLCGKCFLIFQRKSFEETIRLCDKKRVEN